MSALILILALAGGDTAADEARAVAERIAQAERCAGATAAAFETAATPSADLKLAYVTWSSRFSSLAFRINITATEVNTRLEAARLAAQAKPDAALLDQCLADARNNDPLGLR